MPKPRNVKTEQEYDYNNNRDIIYSQYSYNIYTFTFKFINPSYTKSRKFTQVAFDKYFIHRKNKIFIHPGSHVCTVL